MIDIIRDRLKAAKASNLVEEENVTKEIIQEIALYGLYRAKFFDVGIFQGGTSLRILHKLPRFSEDLDFMLLKPDPEFEWESYLKVLMSTFEEFGLKPAVTSKDKMDNNIRHAVIKDDSIANQLDLSFSGQGKRRKLVIKLEIDIAPPAHSQDEYSFLEFPVDHQVRHQDLSSNFALKIHALLCRGHLKGRDWFDFSWYVARGEVPNLKHLEAALQQNGRWAEQPDLSVDWDWLQASLTDKISSIDWDEAKEDVRRFLRPAEAETLDLWSAKFFHSKLAKLMSNSKQ